MSQDSDDSIIISGLKENTSFNRINIMTMDSNKSEDNSGFHNTNKSIK